MISTTKTTLIMVVLEVHVKVIYDHIIMVALPCILGPFMSKKLSPLSPLSHLGLKPLSG